MTTPPFKRGDLVQTKPGVKTIGGWSGKGIVATINNLDIVTVRAPDEPDRYFTVDELKPVEAGEMHTVGRRDTSREERDC